jgi:hypothetical protein
MYPKRLILVKRGEVRIAILPVVSIKWRARLIIEVGRGLVWWQVRCAIARSDRYRQEHGCTPDARGYAIRMALCGISGINDGEVAGIILSRPYLDLADFAACGASRPICEALSYGRSS